MKYIYIIDYLYIYMILSIVILSQNQKINENHRISWKSSNPKAIGATFQLAHWGARQQSSWDVPKLPWSFTQRGARNSENELLKLVDVGGQKSLGKLTKYKICIISIKYPSNIVTVTGVHNWYLTVTKFHGPVSLFQDLKKTMIIDDDLCIGKSS